MSAQEQGGLRIGKDIKEFPIKDEERVCSDVSCAVIGLAFTALLILLSIIAFNQDHYTRTSFPSDSQGRVCGYDLKNHPYVYFTNFPSIKERVCVHACPAAGDPRLNCVPTDSIGCSFSDNPNFTVTYYPNAPESLDIGSFCVPSSESLKQKLYEDIDVTDRYAFFKQMTSILICSVIALGLAIVYTLLVQLFPLLMNQLSVLLGLGFGCVLLLLVAFYPTANTALRISLSVLILVLLAIVALGAFKSRGCFNMHGVFLSYATQLVKSNITIIVFIPAFLVVFVLFILIIIWELKSLWSCAPLTFSQEEVYYQFKGGSTTLATVAVSFQFLWGLSFIKQSFNFCISANAICFYDKEREKEGCSTFKSLKYLFRWHFGSVVAGSFVNLVASLFDYIFDVLRADTDSQGQNRHSCLQTLDTLFDLVRSDAMVFIYLAGNPYCNSSRYCEALCRRSPIAEYSQSISRSYRICSHFLLGGIVAGVNFFLQGSEVSILVVLLVFVVSLFLSTFMISLHADAAEAIQIVFLLDLELARQKEQKKHRKDNRWMGIPELPLGNWMIADDYQREYEKVKVQTQEVKDELN